MKNSLWEGAEYKEKKKERDHTFFVLLGSQMLFRLSADSTNDGLPVMGDSVTCSSNKTLLKQTRVKRGEKISEKEKKEENKEDIHSN